MLFVTLFSVFTLGPQGRNLSGLCVKGFSWALVCFSLRDTVNLVTHSGFLDKPASEKLRAKFAAESKEVYWLSLRL